MSYYGKKEDSFYSKTFRNSLDRDTNKVIDAYHYIQETYGEYPTAEQLGLTDETRTIHSTCGQFIWAIVPDTDYVFLGDGRGSSEIIDKSKYDNYLQHVLTWLEIRSYSVGFPLIKDFDFFGSDED